MSQLSYTDYDFNDLVTQLQTRLKEQSAWTDTYRSSTGQMLLELFAAVGNFVAYSIERRAEETYLSTARNRSSLINMVRLLGYMPHRMISAQGTLRFSVNAPLGKNVFIPKYTSCSTSSGTKFIVSQDAVLIAGQTSTDAASMQGEKQQVSFTGTAAAFQEFSIDDTTVEDTSVVVVVDGVLWTEVDTFIDSDATSLHFMLRTELDDTVTLRFGDGTFGYAPAAGSVIAVTYVKTSGSSGNVYSTGLVTTLNDTLYDSDGTAQTVTVTNTSNFLGGDDVQTTESIRYNAPKVFVAGDRAVTISDYKAILNNYAGVADSNAWGENEENAPNVDMYNRVKIVTILTDWSAPDTTFKTALSTYLQDYAMLTVRYTYVDPEILEIVPTLTELRVLAGYTLDSVQAAVETALEGQFELGTVSKLGEATRHSTVVSAVRAVEGVAYFYLELRLTQDLETGYNSTYTWAQTLLALPVKPGSINLYYGSTLIATDDGEGGWTDLSSTYTITGTVNYTTGAVGVDTSPAISSGTVSVTYLQDVDGNIEPLKYQISKYNSTDVQSIDFE